MLYFIIIPHLNWKFISEKTYSLLIICKNYRSFFFIYTFIEWNRLQIRWSLSVKFRRTVVIVYERNVYIYRNMLGIRQSAMEWSLDNNDNAKCMELKKSRRHVKSRIEIATLGEDTDPDTDVHGEGRM